MHTYQINFGKRAEAMNFGKRAKTMTPQATAIAGSTKLSQYSLLGGDTCLLSA